MSLANPTPDELLAGRVHAAAAALTEAIRAAEAGGLRVNLRTWDGLFERRPSEILVNCFRVQPIAGVIVTQGGD